MIASMTTIIRGGVLILVLVVSMFLGWLWWQDGVAPVDPTDTTPESFIIRKGEGVKAVATKLAQQGLVRSATSFYILVKLEGLETQIQAGEFRLRRDMNASDIASELTLGISDIWVTTLEGWRSEEVATKLAKDLEIPETEFLKYAQEGYMFPDTYLIPQDATAAGVAALFQDTFNKKITKELRSDSTKTGLSFDQVIVLASIVEREGRTDEDRPVIAGILLKRLEADWPLQTDATLQYALGYQSQQKTWWKKQLTNDDKKIQSPFNTYMHTGLPPFPIANPGISSIRAVIYSVDSEYWFYIHDPKGGVHYAKTLEEHNANIQQYLQ